MNLERKRTVDYYLGGFLLVFLKPMVWVTGRVLRRDHSILPQGDIGVIKMLGGGSLVLALPSLLGLRRRYPRSRFVLMSTAGVAPFGKALGLFDEIVEISDRSFPALAASSVRALAKVSRIDTVLDLEVYSRLASVFSLLTLARNRIGFYLESVFWRKNLHTHLVFFNRFSGSYYFYETMCRLLHAEPASAAECRSHLRRELGVAERPVGALRTIGIGHACSENGRERMLSPAQWRRFLAEKLGKDAVRVCFLGGKSDAADADEIIRACASEWPSVEFINLCGQRGLAESLRDLAAMDEFWGIDSALLHFARILGLPTVSFWGPTDPSTRLQPFEGSRDDARYSKVPCSPCIHVAERPPCQGRNACIGSLFGDGKGQHFIPVHTPGDQVVVP